MTVHVSVVVPTYRRPDLLERCLSALLRQDIPTDGYEVIVIDDAACAATQQQVESLACRARRDGLCVRYLADETHGAHGPAAARNSGWRAASGEIIAFTDDDCIPDPAWLRAGIAAFGAGIAGVSGRVIVPLPDDPTDYEYDASHLERGEFVTANCFYRRSVLELVGGFDERFTAPWREDSDLFFTLLERGASCVHAPEAVVVHPVRPSSWGVSIRQQRKSMFNALLYKKHPVLYRQKIQAAPPWLYYAMLGGVLIALLGLLRQSALLQLGGLGLWTCLTGRFCVRRLSRTSRAPGHIAEMIVTSVVIPPLSIFWRLRGMLKFRVFFF